MRYELFRPDQQFREIVQCFWSLESVENEVMPEEYYLMADNCAEIVFQFNGGFQSYSKQSARIRFQHAIHNKFLVEKELGFFGVRLYPGAVQKMLGFPASEVANSVFDLADLFKQQGSDLADQVYHAKNSAARIAMVSGFLLKNTLGKKIDPIDHFVGQIMDQAGQSDIARLQVQSGLSVKQFERRFKAVAGFSPKYFARVARFQSAKQKYCSSGINTLTQLAYACNYFDQSHFIREFKEFSGVQPHHYFKFLKNEKNSAKPTKMMTSPVKQTPYDGYLPCGWFV
jgi:AraC-like DNA-binding protein